MTDSASLHRVRIQHEDVDVNAELDRLAASTAGVGALVSFVGTVRGANDGSAVSQMTLEHYPGMTETSIAAIIDAAFARWSLVDALVVHRVGALPAGARIVL
ncbi:MAG: molybdenum cofactor biosynthesis protein MoaE, partial [Pseudomonadota bacterium]|nr:molybdenum cofactor biosynthesis protein MoaE [Pseudomonadota bacterium]